MSGPASADIARAQLLSSNAPVITVESNGSQYTQVTNASQHITGTIKIELDGGISGRVKSFEAFPRLGYIIGPLSVSWDHFKDSGISRSYEAPGPKSVTETFDFMIPRQHYADFMVAACNNHADKLRGEGKKNSEIFDKDRTLAIGLGGQVEADLSGLGSIEPSPQLVNAPYTIGITCKRDASLDPVTTAIKDAVLVAHTAETNNLTGACELQLSGTIVTQNPNTQVKFRYHSLKGEQSDIKTVTTDGSGFVNFLHAFPLAKGSQQSGKVRMIGTSHALMSNWAEFQADCSEPLQDIATVLPPKAVALEAYAMPGGVVKNNRICPTTVKFAGVMKGRGKVKGVVAISVDGKPKVLEQFQAEDGNHIVVQGEHSLSWEGNNAVKQSVLYRMVVLNLAGDTVDQIEERTSFLCRKPQVAGGNAINELASNDILPKSVALSITTQGQKKLPGWVCPEKARLHGQVTSDDQPLTGKAILYAGASQVAEHDVELEANWGHNYDGEHSLVWNAAGQKKQTMLFTLKFFNQHGHLVKTVEQAEKFVCQKIVVNRAVAGGQGELAPEQKDPLAAQQDAPAAVGQLAIRPDLAILAPKGRIRDGEIRLSGGKPMQTYKLTFFRKAGGKATQVNSAQLPKQMKGKNAGFPLAALTGARAWRLRVCPLGQGPAACETSDFRIPLVAARQQEKAPSKPATAVIVVPGAMN
ncbi:hypothetical protein [Pelagibius marinus]|uniref:hypothetical protein n=1 Tax=Pelagibius marinus TaxID=2762760 RepID=UPI001872BF01|nr:hypothetical protein [Pelagibius marinus]